MRESGQDKLKCRWSWLEHQIDTKSPRRGRVENSPANLNSYAVASFDPVGLDQGEDDQLQKFLKLEQIAGARSPTPFLHSPSKYRLSPFPSVKGDTSISSKIDKAPSSWQKFPLLKDLVGPVNSQRSLKDISVDSQCSLQNWDRSYTFR